MSILYILLALVVLLVLITVHEFGHYCAGKIFGFKINEFSIGFGPAIYKKTRKDGEVFSVRWLPLGGFCAFEGEDEDGVKLTIPDSKRLRALPLLLTQIVKNLQATQRVPESKYSDYNTDPESHYAVKLKQGDDV